MAETGQHGSNWSDAELDAIVADYFAMLQLELAGKAYVKSHHAANLMALTGRSHRSVEFKHMNVSAVLRALGRPTIRGYRPMPNVQGAILDAIERFLLAHPNMLELAPREAGAGVMEASAIFEEPPPVIRADRLASRARLERIVRKFDPATRDARNRTLGRAGEERVYLHEQAKLRAADRADLARNVRWVSEEEGDGAGYDIRSYDLSGSERLIEVKTTYGGPTTPFFLSRNERSLSDERPEAFRLFRLYEFDLVPKLFTLQPPLEVAVMLETETYRASFR